MILINHCSNDFRFKKTFSPFQELFKKAGAVREIQETRLILSEFSYKNSKSIHKELRKYEKKKKEDFFSFYDRTLQRHLIGLLEVVQQHLIHADAKKSVSLLNEEKSKIRQFMNKKNLSPKEMHALRIQLKELHYHDEITGRNPPHDEKKLTSLLGDWHDLYRAIDLLNKMNVNKSNHDVIKTLTEEKTKYRKRILRKIDTIKIN